MAAAGLVGEALFVDRLILRRQRGLLLEALRFTWVPLDATDPDPLARKIRILGFVDGVGRADGQAKRRRGRDGANRSSIIHGHSPHDRIVPRTNWSASFGYRQAFFCNSCGSVARLSQATPVGPRPASATAQFTDSSCEFDSDNSDRSRSSRRSIAGHSTTPNGGA